MHCYHFDSWRKLDSYKLDEPSYEIDIPDIDGKTFKILVFNVMEKYRCDCCKSVFLIKTCYHDG